MGLSFAGRKPEYLPGPPAKPLRRAPHADGGAVGDQRLLAFGPCLPAGVFPYLPRAWP
ncbi:hypothetical protein TSC_c14790 [Thermus scotoductus SA-01]|uniref:Uncharacterized protein n=1 Tax=Thermus scotoductus (strain ATCC 700910 / SA-01) TaxID=743525 RepID=E8PK65_THESS|nr:hypothetical protein TSC_c14790 [Thermus scotoductus SA-01]